ncbi:MAG TPA: aldo/keto reductase [Oscillospiraceae bacterium]|nr:aldo/keto reductase [Oscillospiraceae bacterium]
MNSLSDAFLLNNGVKIPCVGFGTWQTPDGEVAANSVAAAIENGYRHIDTAAVYKNEKGVGEGIRRAGVKRDELFVTTKLWNTDRGYDKTLKAFQNSLSMLRLDYVDLYLIHWPANQKQYKNCDEINADTYKALERILESGRAKAIGVSNFLVSHLQKLLQNTNIVPAVNQIEFHPGYTQEDTVSFCKENNILVEAYSPLGTGQLLNNIELINIAEKYNKSTAQLCIRFVLQKGVLPLPKSVTESRIKENTKVFDFNISDEDMKAIENIKGISRIGSHPDEVPW